MVHGFNKFYGSYNVFGMFSITILMAFSVFIFLGLDTKIIKKKKKRKEKKIT